MRWRWRWCAQDAGPLIHGLRALPSLPADGQWANFVRNHDEWSLDKLTEAERQEVFAAFGPKPEMQLFGRGLRRRLPTMLDGDQARIRMVYSLAFALPGAPVLFYGEEIGMAENLAIPGRQSVRSPMQWSNEENGGFSTAAPERLRRPVVEGKALRPGRGQRRRPARRRELAAQLDGAPDPAPPRVPGDRLGRLAASSSRRRRACSRCATTATTACCSSVHNLAPKRCRATLDARAAPPTGRRWSTAVRLRRLRAAARTARSALELEGYGARWLRARRAGARRLLL